MDKIVKVKFIKARVIPYCNQLGQLMEVSEPVAQLLIARGCVEVVKEDKPKKEKKNADK
jgi:hypothetical protein